MKKYCMLLFLLFSAASHASESCESTLESSEKYSDLNKILACFIGKIKASENRIKALEAELEEVKKEQKSGFILLADRMKTEIQADALISSIKAGGVKSAVTQTVEKQGVKFNLSQCARKGKKLIVCEFSIVSSKDRKLQIYPDGYGGHSTIAIATSGIQYVATSGSLGASGQRKGSVIHRMVSDLPLASSISFSNVPSDEKGFALLEISTWLLGKVAFRDVSIIDQE